MVSWGSQLTSYRWRTPTHSRLGRWRVTLGASKWKLWPRLNQDQTPWLSIVYSVEVIWHSSVNLYCTEAEPGWTTVLIAACSNRDSSTPSSKLPIIVYHTRRCVCIPVCKKEFSGFSFCKIMGENCRQRGGEKKLLTACPVCEQDHTPHRTNAHSHNRKWINAQDGGRFGHGCRI